MVDDVHYSESMSIKLLPGTRDQLKRAATKVGIKSAELIRRAIRHELEVIDRAPSRKPRRGK